MNDEEAIDLSTLSVEEVEEILEDLGVELDPTELRNLAAFVQEVGDVEAALEALAENERKAA